MPNIKKVKGETHSEGKILCLCKRLVYKKIDMAIPVLESHALKSLPPYCSVRNLLFYFLYTCYVRSVLSRGYADISDSDVDPD